MQRFVLRTAHDTGRLRPSPLALILLTVFGLVTLPVDVAIAAAQTPCAPASSPSVVMPPQPGSGTTVNAIPKALPQTGGGGCGEDATSCAAAFQPYPDGPLVLAAIRPDLRMDRLAAVPAPNGPSSCGGALAPTAPTGGPSASNGPPGGPGSPGAVGPPGKQSAPPCQIPPAPALPPPRNVAPTIPIPWPTLTIAARPFPLGLTGLPTWFWIEGLGPIAASTTVSVGGLPNPQPGCPAGPGASEAVGVRAVPIGYTWGFGDHQPDSTVETTSAGVPWPQEQGKVTHTYQITNLDSNLAGGFPVRVTITFRVEYQDGGDAWHPLAPATQAAALDYRVQTIVPVVLH